LTATAGEALACSLAGDLAFLDAFGCGAGGS